MTGTKVLKVRELWDEETTSSSLYSFNRKQIGYSEFFYGPAGIRLGVRRERRFVYLASPQQFTPWIKPRLETYFPPGARRYISPGRNGIHAYQNLKTAVVANLDPGHQANHPGDDAVYAIVRPEGKVVIGEYGWVAEAAVMVRIFLPPRLYLAFSRELYNQYHVPIEVLPRSLRELTAEDLKVLRSDHWRKPANFRVWNRRYGPESGAELWRNEMELEGRPHHGWLWLRLPAAVRRPANIAIWDPAVAAMSAFRWANRPTRKDWGRLGGLARGRKLRAGELPVSGAAVPKPTVCERCGELVPSARQAWRHCRGARGRPRKIVTP